MYTLRTILPFAILLFAGEALAQCSGPSCGVPTSPPAVATPPLEPLPSTPDFVVRIASPLARSTAYGSGGAFRYEDRVGILTAGHVVAGAIGTPTIIVNQKQVTATVVYLNKEEDIAILEPDDVAVFEFEKLPELASSPPTEGMVVFAAGCDAAPVPRAWRARVIGIRRSAPGAGNWFIVSGAARNGDSGGPVWVEINGARKIAGVIWGTNGSQTIFTWIGAVRTPLSRLCWRWRFPQSPRDATPPFFSQPTAPAPVPPPAKQPPAKQPAEQPAAPPPAAEPPEITQPALPVFLAAFFFTLAAMPLVRGAYLALLARRKFAGITL